MHRVWLICIAAACAAATGDLVTDIRALIAAGNFAQAEREIATWRSRPDTAEAQRRRGNRREI